MIVAKRVGFGFWLRRAVISVLVIGAANGCVDEKTAAGKTSTDIASLSTRWTGSYTDVNVASAQMGATANSSGAYSTEPAWTIIDGNRSTTHTTAVSGGYPFWGSNFCTRRGCTCNIGNWWVTSTFNGVHSISEIDLYSLQDNYTSGYEPTASTVTSLYGSVNVHISYCPVGVTCGSALNSGWVDVPSGYVTGNNLAVVTRSFPPVSATAIRAQVDCSQSNQAYVTEIEAWEHTNLVSCTPEPPMLHEAPAITGTSSTQIIHDSDVFWGSPNGFNGVDEPAEKANIHAAFLAQVQTGAGPPIWDIGRQALAAAQMYDRLAPIDTCRANHYLEFLRVQAEELLLWRDDKQGYPADGSRNRVMAAWGWYAADRDGRWNDDVVVAGLFTYPMAAFAKRVAANPSSFSVGYQQDAIRFTTAVMQTYASFRPELHFLSTDPSAYHITPPGYATLACTTPGYPACWTYKADANNPEEWNEDIQFMRTLAEAASAADSSLYRNSSDPYKSTTISYLAVEAPEVIAKYVQFFDNYLSAHLLHWSGDNAPYYVWNKGYAGAGSGLVEDTPHGQVTVSSLALILENKPALDGMLARAGYLDHINLDSSIMKGFATTFTRLLWNTDNTIGDTVDGNNDGTPTRNWNIEVGGFITLAPYDSWVWQRAHDSLFAYPSSLREDNYAALIRYE